MSPPEAYIVLVLLILDYRLLTRKYQIFRPDDWQYSAAGGFGDVFRCQYMSDDGVKEVAVKAFRFSFSVDSENKHDGEKVARMIRRELGIWRRLNHPNIVPFLGITYGFGKQGGASLVSMWMLHDTLHTFLEAHDDRLEVVHRLQLAMHSFPMIHGDLTSNNVLLDHNYNARLTDFGCASLVGELPGGFTYLKASTVRQGTLRWAAPEHFSFDEGETKHTIKSDIYSFGNMALLVLSGKYPWSEVRADAAVMLRLSQGLKPGRPLARPIDDRHWAFIERCWSSIPDRPLVEDLVSSLQQFLGGYPSSPRIRELFAVPSPSSDLPNLSCRDELGDDVTSMASQQGIAHKFDQNVRIQCPVSQDAYNHAERQFSGRPRAGSESIVLTPNKHVTEASIGDASTISRWVRGRILGQGTYGRVYLALNMSNGEMFAVKQVEKENHNTHRLNFVSELKMEAEILRGLRHPHIVAYLGSEETTVFLNIFLEYIPGTIESRLDEHGKFNGDVIKSFAAQIYDGLAYLHANHIIHRNIEAGNILVDASGHCKLSGFGNAQHSDDDRASWTPMRGTMFWTVPEVTRSQGGQRYGPKVDIWTAGCVLLKMWTGAKTWRDADVIAMVIKATHRGTSPPLPAGVILSDLAVDFRNRCFAIDPEARASATELLQHAYLTLDADHVSINASVGWGKKCTTWGTLGTQ
ncbi:Protein kinase-like domain containing protein [Tylopilus felleus]